MYLVVIGSVQSAGLSRQNQDVPRVAGSHSTRKRQRRLRRSRKRKGRGLTKLSKRTTTGDAGKNIVTLFFVSYFNYFTDTRKTWNSSPLSTNQNIHK